MKRVFFIFILLLQAVVIPSWSPACGHDGFYLGAGYNQLFMFSWDKRLVADPTPPPGRVHFGPGFGGHAVVGYDIPESRWGVQVPFEYARIKLNRDEWVNSFTNAAEAVFHIVSWESGIDFKLVGGVGWAYLSEGSIEDRSKNFGIAGGIGPSLSYFFARDVVTAAVVLEVPVRGIYFFGHHLSENRTFVLSVPIKIGVEIGFP